MKLRFGIIQRIQNQYNLKKILIQKAKQNKGSQFSIKLNKIQQMQCYNNYLPTSGSLNEQSQFYDMKIPKLKIQCQCNKIEFHNCSQQNELIDDTIELRKKIHQSKSENFSLKQELSRLRKSNLELESINSSLKDQIHQNLNQLTISDSEIQRLKLQLTESVKYGQFMQSKITSLEQQLQQSQSVIEKQSQYIKNLNQENLLLIEMKQVLIQENHSLKASYHQISIKYEMKEKQIQKLNIELDYLFKDIQNLQELLHNKNEEILTYELFLNTKDQQIKQTRYFEGLILQEKFAKKIQKYRKKALKYKKERDLLLAEIQEAKQQIGTITLRKYIDSDTDTFQQNYSFQKPFSHHSHDFSSNHLN